MKTTEIALDIKSAVEEDLPKLQIWKRDTEVIIEMLKHRKATLPHGSWEKYLTAIEMASSTAHYLMKKNQIPKTADLEKEDAEIESEDQWQNFRYIELNIPPVLSIKVENNKLTIHGTIESLNEYKAKLGRAKLKYDK